MPKKQKLSTTRPIRKLIRVVGWITGVLVALAVGFGMIDGTLSVPYISSIVPVAGWIVVVLTILGIIMALIDRAK